MVLKSALLVVSATALVTLAISRGAAQVPSVNLTGTWKGTGHDTYLGRSDGIDVTWALTQIGSTVSGTVKTSPLNPNDGSCSSCHRDKTGTLSGTVSGTALTLTMDFPGHNGEVTSECTVTFTGTAATIANDAFTTSYSGTDSCEGDVLNGTLQMARQAPAVTSAMTLTFASGGTTTVDIVGSVGAQAFSPNPASLGAGQPLRWKNSDFTTHRIVMDDGSLDTGDISPGASSTAGRVSANGGTYHCTIHPSMVGTIQAAVLRLGATKSPASSTLIGVTPAQAVSVTFTGAGSAWTASADQSWVQLGGSSGSGAGQFTVGIVNPGNVIGASTSLSATITVTAPGATNSPLTIPVRLTVTAPESATTAAFGAFDTPANNATALVGSIPVTGWALDDVGVQRVEIWRNCVEAIDRPAGACFAATPGGAANFVFIGTGAFLTGARPDVEAAFATTPVAYRAGWGYLMLTNALPHVPSGLREGGQGTFTLSAYAVDVEKHYTLLGTKTITLDNDHATIPFGAIDTPTQGGIIPEASAPYNNANAYPNFGWAMTQIGKCIDTASTSAYRVYIDGISRPLTPGVNWFPGLNRSDIAAAYPGYCNTTNALAAYYINADALGLANGLHTIGWDVIDDQGHVAGIGSRFFIVSH